MDVGDLAKIGGATSFGAAVVVVFAFYMEWIVPGKVYRAAVERAEKAEARLWEWLPVMRKTGEVMERSVETVRTLAEAKNADGKE